MVTSPIMSAWPREQPT